MIIADIIVALLGIIIILLVIRIEKDKDKIETYSNLYLLRVALTENESKFSKKEIDEVTYYFNLNHIKQEIADFERGLR